MTPYYEPEGGGLERYAHEILHRLSQQGHEVQALSFTRNGAHGDEHKDGVAVHRIPPRFIIGNSPVHLRFAAMLEQRIKEFQPDVMVAHTPVPFPAETAARAARRRHVPFVVTYHAGHLRGSSWPLDLLATLDRHSFERRMLQSSQALIAVSPFVRQNALNRVQERVRIVPPGVDMRRFSPTGPPSPDPHILFVGPISRNYRWKGLDVLWQAYRRVQKRFPQAALTLVGKGDRKAEFEALGRKHGLDVRLPGRLDEASLVEAYGSSHVVVLPSTSDAESFGMVLAEANACARPVVASNIGGIPDFVRHRENGLLVPPGDPAALADRITQILLDPEQASRMGQRGRQIVRSDHDWDNLAARTQEVFVEAGAQKRP